MVLKYTNKTDFILLDGFARVCTVSANFPDNPRTCRTPKKKLSLQEVGCQTQPSSSESWCFSSCASQSNPLPHLNVTILIWTQETFKRGLTPTTTVNKGCYFSCVWMNRPLATPRTFMFLAESAIIWHFTSYS